MAKLRELEPVVIQVLKTDEESRKDDSVLIFRVYEALEPSIDNMSFKTVMLCRKQLKLPSQASITRCRRKVCETYPELRDIDTMELRVEEQEGYIKYALNLG